jgi:hypothetical protein
VIENVSVRHWVAEAMATPAATPISCPAKFFDIDVDAVDGPVITRALKESISNISNE